MKGLLPKKRVAIILMLSICFNAQSQEVVSLYADSIPNSKGDLMTEADNPTLTVYLPSKEKQNGTSVIIFPGGAYGFLANSTEGTPIAKAFTENGFVAFVLKYRLPSDAKMNDKSMGPLMDAQQAIKFVRDNSKEYNIDINKVGIIGYSAGGHLASTLGTHYSTSYIPNKENTKLRPDFMILVYPVISMDSILTHKGSRNNLIGKMAIADQVIFFSNEKQVTSNTPPTFLTHAKDDKLVTYKNSEVFYEACLKNNVLTEIKLVETGDHGFTQRLPVNEWLDPMLAFLKRQGFYSETK